jgi:GNAT superfamily N-acetyltransferase
LEYLQHPPKITEQIRLKGTQSLSSLLSPWQGGFKHMPETRRRQNRKGARVKLRRATRRDIDVLVRQRRGMWFGMGERNRIKLKEHDRTFRHWVQLRLKDRTVVGWVAETDGGDAVAGAIVWLRPAPAEPGVRHLVQPYLLSMYTDPRWRRLGLASRIVTEAVKWAKSNGYGEIRLHASSMGRRIYIRHGFKRTWEMKREL